MKLPILISLSLTPGSAPKARPADKKQSAVTPAIRTFEATSLSCPSCAINAKAFLQAHYHRLRVRLSVFPSAALSEGRSRVPIVSRRWRAPQLRLSEGRKEGSASTAARAKPAPAPPMRPSEANTPTANPFQDCHFMTFPFERLLPRRHYVQRNYANESISCLSL